MKIEPKESAEKHLEEIFDSYVEPADSELKIWLINYVGDKLKPENNQVTVHNIISVLSEEFPDALLAIAEENWIRGYHQALSDVDAGQKAMLEATAEKLNND